MLLSRTMLGSVRPKALATSAAFVGLGASLLLAAPARAQTTTGGVVTASGQVNPVRYYPDQVTVFPSRQQNFNPLGVSYSDCIGDATLKFEINVSGFTGTQNMQIWATRSGDCTSQTSRGIGSAAQTCWLVNPGFTAVAYSSMVLTYFVRVQDIVGFENGPPLITSNYVRQGPGACSVQNTFAAVPMDIFFLPLDSSGAYTSGAYDYKIATDLAGPPPPIGVNAQVGDTLFIVNWTPNTDSDTAGYDIYMDPIRGQEEAGVAANGTTTVTTCPDATSSPAVDAGNSTVDADDGASSDGASSDGTSSDGDDGATGDATIDDSGSGGSTTTSSADACSTITVGGSNSTAGSCTSTIITSANASDAAAVSTEVFDQDGDLIDGSASTGAYGISTVPCKYILDAVCDVTKVTVSDRATNTHLITGLKNGRPGYDVTVSAVDGFGNIGPPSAEVCDFPDLVNDFWSQYREAGGKAGGGLCTLEIVGDPAASTLSVVMLLGLGGIAIRRRRSRSARGGAGAAGGVS